MGSQLGSAKPLTVPVPSAKRLGRKDENRVRDTPYIMENGIASHEWVEPASDKPDETF